METIKRSMPWGKERRPNVDHPIFTWCEKHHVQVKHFTPYQTRLFVGEKSVCDVYLTNMRYHIIRHPNKEMIQKRGDIPNDFVLLLESLFLNIH